MALDQELSRCLKAGLKALTRAERQALVSIWRYPNIPVKILPTMVGDEPGGSVWLRVGMLAKTKLWDRMPRRIKFEFQRPRRKPFYSGLLVNLSTVEDKRRERWTVFELRPEAVKALQDLEVIGRSRRKPSSDYRPLDEAEVQQVPAGFSAPAETKRINRAIIARKGQAPFRRALLDAYDGRCAVTGCTEINVLEAAHIVGHRSCGRYEVANGLLLRADWHTLFDLGLWAVHPKWGTIEVSPDIAQEYQKFDGRPLRAPNDTKLAPGSDALEKRYKRFQRLLRG
ncbi:HNH endonuclease [Bradyrhizobium sp. SZCCHNS3004]|uniref:HNH endonuclease n=1 Tax=Bradyrhizobium sp. SZCCHNS3004 TaxID=3057312 RepID=UPI0029165BF6|nr:HNH endonuclease [Bradyrhizobium sp. SZCCHNS3004]